MFDGMDPPEGQLAAFRADVFTGLSRPRKTLPSRWLYDRRGSELFEAITELDEYYPTRTETQILKAAGEEIAELIGPGAILVEYGAGAGLKTEGLLARLRSPRLYVPVDISSEFLIETADRLRRRFPDVQTRPVTADFTADFSLPSNMPEGRRTVFFPGSTIGNLNENETAALLDRMRVQVGANGTAVIGFDLKKDTQVLLAAYDDTQGVTAAFNLNLLERINRELGADFVQGHFRHEARWNSRASAVEMHLVSLERQVVRVGAASFAFAEGETIHTESSRKYDPLAFSELIERHGWTLRRTWTDPDKLFAVCGLVAS